jgi:hypothetical protein
VVGWLAVAISTLLAGLWGFWGIVENFHEGWYHGALGPNVAMLLGQYMSPMAIFLVMGLVGVRWPWVGAALHVLAAGAVFGFFRGASVAVIGPFIAGPLALLGAGYAWGRPEPRRWAAATMVGLPLLTVIGFGIEPAIRVAGRIDDGLLGLRRVTSGGVDLVWAPQGPGWPSDGVSWDEAVRRCRHLSDDGATLLDSPVDIWRLPTIEEAVRSMHRQGAPCGGAWSPATRQATYARTPDKESPLWDTRSKVIYWWTATEASERDAFIVVYDGKVWPRPKTARWGYLAFRAVRAPPASP